MYCKKKPSRCLDSFLSLYRVFIFRIVRLNFIGNFGETSAYVPICKKYKSFSVFYIFYIFESPYLVVPNDSYIVNFHDCSSFCQILASYFLDKLSSLIILYFSFFSILVIITTHKLQYICLGL